MGPVASVPRSGDRVDGPASGGFTLDVFEHMFEQPGSGSRPVPGHPSGCTDLDPRAPGRGRLARVLRGEAPHPGRLPPSPSSPGVLAHQRAVTNLEERPDDPTL